MVGPTLLSLLLLIDPKGSTVDVSGGVAAELRVGRAPISINEDPEAAVLMILTPNVDLLYRTRRFGALSAGYSPRVQWRQPNRLSVRRPLILHQLYLNHDAALGPRWTLSSGVSGSVGELDYTTLTVALGADQSILPDADVTDYLVGGVDFRLDGRLTPVHRLTISPSVGYRTPIGESREMAVDGDVALPTQINASLNVAHAYIASQVDTVTTTVRPGYVDYNGQTSFVSTDARVAWSRQLDLRLSSRLDAGVFAARTVRRGDQTDPNARALQAFPVGQYSLTGRLLSRSSHYVDGIITLGVMGYFDRLLDTVSPRGQGQIDISTTIPPRWVVTASLSAFTPLTADPRITAAGVEQPDETVIRGQTPVTYAINDNTRFEFGTVFSVRASHLAASRIRFSRLETWLYVAVRFGGSTARGNDELAGRGSGQVGTGTGGIGARAGGQ